MDDPLDFALAAVPMSDGSWVSPRVARVAEIIADYDPRLEVRWLPRDKRLAGDAAFQIVEHTRDGHEVVAFTVASEAEFDERVLERIFLADNARADVQGRLEAHNAAVRAMELKKALEADEEARDIAATVFASPLNTYRHAGLRFDKPYGGRERGSIKNVG